MKKLQKSILQKISEYENLLKYIDSKDFPEGSLVINNKGRRFDLYHNISSGFNKRKVYIKSDSVLAYKLADKRYLLSVKKIILKHLTVLKNFKSIFEDDINTCFDKIPNRMKPYIRPLVNSIAFNKHIWNSMNKSSSKYLEENLKYQTIRGEFVRSKSEMIIANILFELGIDYKYEYPFGDESFLVYPDFTIFHPITGEIYYLEHFGMMDDEIYANDFIKKVKFYENKGVYVEDKLLISFESKKHPFDAKSVRSMIIRRLDI